jgi:4-amino-4-deoxy-L-arabinose transferase-like glycosyltransferase
MLLLFRTHLSWQTLASMMKRTVPYIILSIVCIYFRIPFLDSDFHILEPDEGLFYGLMKQWQDGRWPLYYGRPFVETFPLFTFLASKLDPLVKNLGIFASLRLLSVFGALVLGISLFYYWTVQKNTKSAWIAPLTLWFIPLFYFYSLSGTMDVLYISLASSSVLLLVISLDHKRDLSHLSALLFSLAVLIKFSAWIFVPSFVCLWLLTAGNVKVWKKFTITLVGILGIVFIPYLMMYGTEMIRQSIQYPSRHLLPLNISIHLYTWQKYLQNSPWWLSWPFALVTGIGILSMVRKKPDRALLGVAGHNGGQAIRYIKNVLINITALKRKCAAVHLKHIETISHTLVSLLLLVPGLLFISLFDFSPRYYLLLIPAFVYIYSWIFSSYHLSVAAVIFISLLPFTYTAWLATQHMAIRSLKKIVLETSLNHSSLGIYATIDPEKLEAYFDTKVALLSPQATQGGIIITDEIKTRLFAGFSQNEYKQMLATLDQICDRKRIFTYTDPLIHFPVSSASNTYTVYLIPQGISLEKDCGDTTFR